MSEIAGWISEFMRQALAGENRAIFALAVVALLAAIAVVRKKFDAWLLIPIIAGLIWFGLIRWVRDRA